MNFTTDTAFEKIVVVNDWGSVGYYLGVKPSASGTWSHAGLRQGLRLHHGDELEVLFPDKTRMAAIVQIRRVAATVSDHGSTYEVPSEELSLVFDKKPKWHGVEVDIDFRKVKVRRPTNKQ